jgi:hypothetical protein
MVEGACEFWYTGELSWWQHCYQLGLPRCRDQEGTYQMNRGTHKKGTLLQIPSTDYDRSGKKLENVKYFNCPCSLITNIQNVQVKYNHGLLWKKQHSTCRRHFSPANFT